MEALKKSEKQILSLEDLVSGKSNQLLSHATKEKSRIENVSVLKRHVTDLIGKLDCSKAQNSTDRALLEKAFTALAIYQADSARYANLRE